MMTDHILGRGDLIGRVLCEVLQHPTVPDWLDYTAKPVSRSGGILDVGCGSGSHLLDLHTCGYKNLLGIDPYISEQIAYKSGVQIKKCDLKAINQNFSLVMFHHVFEHLENPLETLMDARRLLKPEGQIMIRIPLSDSTAADRYREKWVQLDAPRHVTLQTRKSMELLAAAAGLRITRVTYDSTAFQFWGSEQYLKNIPLFGRTSYAITPDQSIFSEQEMMSFRKASEELNRTEKGDQAVFILEI